MTEQQGIMPNDDRSEKISNIFTTPTHFYERITITIRSNSVLGMCGNPVSGAVRIAGVEVGGIYYNHITSLFSLVFTLTVMDTRILSCLLLSPSE